jgi:anti-sigma factor RsiW
MSCSRTIDVERYYDGELPPAEAKHVEAHLRECPACRQVYLELGCLSELLVSAPLAAISPVALTRIQEARRAAREWGIRRAASWLTAAAAAVLVGALLTWPADRTEGGGQLALWQTAAVMPPSEPLEDAGGGLLLAAQWMADDLSIGQMR